MTDSVASGERSGRSKDTSTFSWKTLLKSLLQSWAGVRKPRGDTGRRTGRALLSFTGVRRRGRGRTIDTSAMTPRHSRICPCGQHPAGFCSVWWMSDTLH